MAGWRCTSKSVFQYYTSLSLFLYLLFKPYKLAASSTKLLNSKMGKTSTSSSSSTNSRRKNVSSNVSSSITHQNTTPHLSPDLRLGLSISTTQQFFGTSTSRGQWHQQGAEVNDCNDYNSFFVKVYMEGIPIGRKLNLLAHGGYQELVNTLEQMFDTTILWGTDMDGMQSERCHVLTYEDGEGDLIMVGDVPWEMFLSSVKRLKITRVDAFGC